MVFGSSHFASRFDGFDITPTTCAHFRFFITVCVLHTPCRASTCVFRTTWRPAKVLPQFFARRPSTWSGTISWTSSRAVFCDNAAGANDTWWPSRRLSVDGIARHVRCTLVHSNLAVLHHSHFPMKFRSRRLRQSVNDLSTFSKSSSIARISIRYAFPVV